MKAIIEIPKHSYYKYEVDTSTGKLTLDRVLDHDYPHNYGFIPDTLCEDGDPLDVFVLSEHAIPPLTEVDVEVLGVLTCLDGGVPDPKLVVMIQGDKRIHSNGWEQTLSNFLHRYKPGFQVTGIADSMVAIERIEEYRAKFEAEKAKNKQEILDFFKGVRHG